MAVLEISPELFERVQPPDVAAPEVDISPWCVWTSLAGAIEENWWLLTRHFGPNLVAATGQVVSARAARENATRMQPGLHRVGRMRRAAAAADETGALPVCPDAADDLPAICSAADTQYNVPKHPDPFAEQTLHEAERAVDAVLAGPAPELTDDAQIVVAAAALACRAAHDCGNGTHQIAADVLFARFGPTVGGIVSGAIKLQPM